MDWSKHKTKNLNYRRIITIFTETNKQTLIERVANQYFTNRGIDPSPEYETAIHRTIETMAFYCGESIDGGSSSKTAVIPLEPGLGKSSLIAPTLAELHKLDRSGCGTLVLLEYQDACDRMAEEINELAGREIAVPYYYKSKFKRSDLKKYPIIVLCHARFLSGIESLTTYAAWRDYKNLNLSEIHELSRDYKERRRCRLIVDESVNKLEILTIDPESLKLLDVFFQNQKSMDYYKNWQKIRNKIDEFFVLPIEAKKRNQLYHIKLEEAIPRELNEVAECRGTAKTKKAFKAIRILAMDGGFLKTSTNEDYRNIQVSCYIDIFSPFFSAVVLDGTSRLNATYNYHRYFDMIDIPKTKDYSNLTLHIDPRTSGSRSAIKKDERIFDNTATFIAEKLSDENVLLICHKDNKEMFKSVLEARSNISVSHWGEFSGTNDYRDKSHIVFCGLPHITEAHYVHLYYAFSGDKDYAKQISYRPRGKADPVMRFDNPDFEEIRQSHLAVEIVQSLNRGIIRNYDNKIQMHGFLPFNDYEVLELVEEELTGVTIVEDYDVVDKDGADGSHEEGNNMTLEETVFYILKNHDEFFPRQRQVSKNDVFSLCVITDNYRVSSYATKSRVWRSPEIAELKRMDILSIARKVIVFNKVA